MEQMGSDEAPARTGEVMGEQHRLRVARLHGEALEPGIQRAIAEMLAIFRIGGPLCEVSFRRLEIGYVISLTFEVQAAYLSGLLEPQNTTTW